MRCRYCKRECVNAACDDCARREHPANRSDREETPLLPSDIHPPPMFNRDCDREDLCEVWNFWNERATLDNMMEFRELLIARGMATPR